jgi:hypothetical protein
MAFRFYLFKQGLPCLTSDYILFSIQILDFVRLGRRILLVSDLGNPVLSRVVHYCFAFVASTKLSVAAMAFLSTQEIVVTVQRVLKWWPSISRHLSR